MASGPEAVTAFLKTLENAMTSTNLQQSTHTFHPLGINGPFDVAPLSMPLLGALSTAANAGPLSQAQVLAIFPAGRALLTIAAAKQVAAFPWVSDPSPPPPYSGGQQQQQRSRSRSPDRNRDGHGSSRTREYTTISGAHVAAGTAP